MPVITYPAVFEVAVPGAQAVFRNGFQYTLLTRGDDIRRQPGITIHDVLSSSPNTCSFTVDGTSNVPILGEKIEIIDTEDGDRLLFAGTVITVTQIYEGQTDQLAFAVECADFTWLMNKKRPFGTYVNVSATEIVKDLVSNYAPGFTTAHVQTGLAKVSAVFDGSQTMSEAFSAIAAAIGGGHHKVDYFQDVHFFHIPPPDLPLSEMPFLGANMTIAAGSGIPSTFTYDYGYYLMRHTFVYNDGTESQFGSISNVILLDGTKQIQHSAIPLGVNIGAKTVVARRIYVNRFKGYNGSASEGNPIEKVEKYVQINDNTTTSFTSFYGTEGADSAAVVAIPSDTSIPEKAFQGHPDGPVTGPTASANFIENGDPRAVALGLVGDFWNGQWVQFKVACLYRDGSVSYPSPASNSTGLIQLIRGIGMIGFNLSNIPIGVSVSGNDVVARFFYICAGISKNPNYSVTWPGSGPPLGYIWPIPFYEPDWMPAHVSTLIGLIPENTSTVLNNFSQSSSGADQNPDLHFFGQTPVGVGRGNLPYGNPNILSSDPIPIWPNPDGPNLEDVDPPEPLTVENLDLLHEDSGSQAFTVTRDSSQVRNRIFVIGSGSITTETAEVGATSLKIADISTMSPHGGKVRVVDPGTGIQFIATYSGLSGVVGNAGITLNAALKQRAAQGCVVNNFFQADDEASQQALAKSELDKDGNKTDGIHEFTIVDSSLKATFQLYMRAYAELELFANPIVTVRYATRDPKTKAGQTIHIDMTNPPCFGDFLIQDVTIDQIRDEGDQLAPRYTVTATSVKFELNDLLLQIVGNNQFGSGVVNGGGGGAGIAPASVLTTISGSGAPQEITIHLTSQQIKTLNTTQLTVVPAPGSGKILVLLYALLHMNQPVPYSATNTWELKYSISGNTPTQGQNSITDAQSFCAGGVPQNRWAMAVQRNQQFYDADIPAVGQGNPTNKGLVLRASVDNTGDPGNVNTGTLKVVFFVADAP